VGFLQQTLEPIVELDAGARDLVLAAHHRSPEPLLDVWHKAQSELLCDQALY
jgi:hypothetical protein